MMFAVAKTRPRLAINQLVASIVRLTRPTESAPKSESSGTNGICNCVYRSKRGLADRSKPNAQWAESI